MSRLGCDCISRVFLRFFYDWRVRRSGRDFAIADSRCRSAGTRFGRGEWRHGRLMWAGEVGGIVVSSVAILMYDIGLLKLYWTSAWL